MAVKQVDKLISKAAKEKLKPMGLFQVGTSRIWVDDNGWVFTVVEYQPSSWSQGTYLNVAACFLWEQSGEAFKDVLPYCLGGRVYDHIEYRENDECFYQKILDLSDFAIKEVEKYRVLFSDKKQIFQEMEKDIVSPSLNKYWDIAMFHYLWGNIATGDEAMKQALACGEAEKEFSINGKRHTREWVIEKDKLGREIVAMSNKQEYVLKSINEKRERLNQKAKYRKMLSSQFKL